MYLKRIFLNGFKSFADRTEFEFGPGMTSIVGPNGCGKSNVLDALRWVLGEQSAKSLRGSRMTDVVFAGSRSRKPANFAEVRLTFDNHTGFLNCDQPEVTVGRMLYRSGESEYSLNGVNCRLKDIRELFLDTGVGVDAYCVIEQGRVDALLQASPQDRREIFEEAAGISRYKVRRTEAQRKLERAQQNLARLNDVLDELEKRLRSVKLAAGKARKYQELDARLRELRSAFALTSYHELIQKRSSTERLATNALQELQGLRARLGDADAQGAELAHRLQSLDEAIQATEARARELQSEQSALSERVVQEERRITDLGAQAQQREQEAAQIRERAAGLAAEAQRAEAEVAERQSQVETLMAQCAALADALTAATTARDEVRRQVDAQRQSAFDAARQAALLQNELANLEHDQARILSQMESAARRQEETSARQLDLAGRITRGEAQVGEYEARGVALRERLTAMEATLAQLQAEVSAVDERVRTLREARTGLQGRLELLEDLERRLEGVDQGTQAVLAWRQGDPSTSVLGLVADLVHVDPERLAVLQPLLGLVENYAVVREMHAFLAEVAAHGLPAGRVDVIALDRLTNRPRMNAYAGSPGYVARVSDWVHCDPQFQGLLTDLFGETYVVDCVERALALADTAASDQTFLSLDGYVIRAGGRLIVGTAGSAPGLISRKTQLRTLRTELADLEAELDQAVRQRSRSDERLAEARLEREGILDEVARAQALLTEARTELLRQRDEQSRTHREATAITQEAERAAQSLTALETRIQQVQQQHQEAAARCAAADSDLAALVQAHNDHEVRVAQAERELADQRVERGRALERQAASTAALEARLAEVRRLEAEAAEALERARALSEQQETLRGQSTQTRARQVEAARELAERDAELLGQRARRQEARLAMETQSAAARELQRAAEQVDARLQELRVELRETQVRAEELIARVRDELGLELTELYANYEHAEQDWDAVRNEIEDLRGRIARLGNVNLDAITELEELEPRFENLSGQRADLLESIRRLEALIAEIDTESLQRFTSTFAVIREHFQELFRKLFGGGRADIVLEDPERPLECGIEVIARPPGKEPQSISLLSGGERTMTAVGLLMAVFKSKPSPFAILDEVDAALDESNINRFNNLLNDFLDESQFIVITHNKRTMQRADMLYGVTMEEPGVSKCVSVRFDDRVESPHVA